MEMSGQLHVPVALPTGTDPRYPLDKRLGEHQSWSGRCGKDKNLLPLPGIEPWPSSQQSVTIPNEITRFLVKIRYAILIFL
jgi:hypothetical protein